MFVHPHLLGEDDFEAARIHEPHARHVDNDAPFKAPLVQASLGREHRTCVDFTDDVDQGAPVDILHLNAKSVIH